MTYEEAVAEAKAGKTIRCHTAMAPGWEVRWLDIPKAEGLYVAKFEPGEKMATRYLYEPNARALASDRWRVVE